MKCLLAIAVLLFVGPAVAEPPRDAKHPEMGQPVLPAYVSPRAATEAARKAAGLAPLPKGVRQLTPDGFVLLDSAALKWIAISARLAPSLSDARASQAWRDGWLDSSGQWKHVADRESAKHAHWKARARRAERSSAPWYDEALAAWPYWLTSGVLSGVAVYFWRTD